MERYISNKVVHAKEMSSDDWVVFREGLSNYSNATVGESLEGYLVCYGSGTSSEYFSWSPKEQFESGNTISTSGEYGINHEQGCVDVIFGDGMTGVQPLGYDDGMVGVVICRDGKHSEPFGFNDDKDTYLSKEDKVFIRFKNEISIQVVIDSLEEAKGFMS